MCNFVDGGSISAYGKDTRVIYRHYATLYFIFVVDGSESELGILDLIQVFVEVLDKCFENVCELDLIFNSDKVHYILDEIIMGGMVLETNIADVRLGGAALALARLRARSRPPVRPSRSFAAGARRHHPDECARGLDAVAQREELMRGGRAKKKKHTFFGQARAEREKEREARAVVARSTRRRSAVAARVTAPSIARRGRRRVRRRARLRARRARPARQPRPSRRRRRGRG